MHSCPATQAQGLHCRKPAQASLREDDYKPIQGAKIPTLVTFKANNREVPSPTPFLNSKRESAPVSKFGKNTKDVQFMTGEVSSPQDSPLWS